MSSRLQRTCTRLLYLVLVFTPSSALAQCDINDPTTTSGIECTNQNGLALFGQGGILMNVINMMIAVIGIAAVIMLIVGGFKYVFSQGNKETIASAKDTILYAIIGIVVAVLAFAIVNFVLAGLA